MTTTFEALPTWHNGCLFRSRIEARWAMFFDHQQVDYHYEEQGYRIGPIFYLPDFHLPDLAIHLEVKGPSGADLSKPQAFAEAVWPESAVYTAVGGIPSYRQLAWRGWWDPDRQTGVRPLAPAFAWEMWFPARAAAVQEACDAARSARFDRTSSVA